MCRCSPINRYLQPRFQGTSQQSFRIVPKQAHFFLILIINQSKYCTLHKITPSQPSKCHKIPNHLRAAHRYWNASLLFNNNKKSLFLNLVNQNILGEISNGHHSPPSLLHHPMSHDALHQEQPAADRWLLRYSLLVRLYKVKHRDGEHHRRFFCYEPGRGEARRAAALLGLPDAG